MEKFVTPIADFLNTASQTILLNWGVFLHVHSNDMSEFICVSLLHIFLKYFSRNLDMNVCTSNTFLCEIVLQHERFH